MTKFISAKSKKNNTKPQELLLELRESNLDISNKKSNYAFKFY